jgi:hypothetical protein
MQLPIPKFLATASANISIADGTDENGALKVIDTFSAKARLQQSNSVVYTKEGVKVSLKAKLFVFEKFDRIPDDAHGFCEVENEKYDIANVSKKRDPDNSIHHIVLELI